MRKLPITMFFVGCSAVLLCQIPDAAPSFEVASIKPSKTSGKPTLRVMPGGRAVGTNVTLKYLIVLAYDVRDYQISGGPKWMGSAEYDIDAKPATPFQPSFSTRGHAMKMQQALLEDRFGLKVKRVTKEEPVYILSVGKEGPKLKAREKPANPADMRMSGGSGLMVGQAMPMTIVVESLASVLGRPVKDETGLMGYYDFRLEWAPDETAAAAGDDTRPSVFTALQQQLGLRLESRRGPAEVLEVESAVQLTGKSGIESGAYEAGRLGICAGSACGNAVSRSGWAGV